MVFHLAKLRVKELAKALNIDCPEIIATCTILEIPASSPLSSLTIDQCTKIIEFLQENKD